jgi:DnaJ domain
MTFGEGAVIVVGVFAGYWAVSKLFFRAPTATVKPAPEPSAAPPEAGHQPDCYEILTVAPTASAAEIRAAYKQLISKYHPDKVESLGQELKDLAERKTQEITRAYRDAMRAQGENP